MKPINYKPTILACFIGYTVQAITINFAPLLYVTFGNEFGLSISQISALIAVCFLVQLMTDAFAAKFSDKLNPRITVVGANLLAAIGIAGMGFFPMILPPYAGLLLATVLSGTGSGFVEVMVSPIVEACPTKRKSAMMSLLHSFYCWGQALVALLSNLFFVSIGISDWRILAIGWALIPFGNAILFACVPLPVPESGKENGNLKFTHTRMFWALVAVMLCAGASEMAMAQWASSFAESALGISKTLGDIAGPFLFAVLMGSARVLYAKFSTHVSLRRLMIVGGVLCMLSYLLAAVAPHPFLALAGCALCGLAVGIMWPGGLSMAAGTLPHGGVAMFALLALAGDLGCLTGPTAVGAITDLIGGDLRLSFLFALFFPMFLIVALLYLSAQKKKQETLKNSHPQDS